MDNKLSFATLVCMIMIFLQTATSQSENAVSNRREHRLLHRAVPSDDFGAVDNDVRELQKRESKLHKALAELRKKCREGCKRYCKTLVKTLILRKRGVDSNSFCDDCSWCCYIWKIVYDGDKPDGDTGNGATTKC